MKIHSTKITKKLLEYLLYTWVFLVPWQTAYLVREVFVDDDKWQYGTLTVYFSDIVLIAGIALAIKVYHSHFIRQLKGVRGQFLFWAMCVLIVWVGVSAVWAQDFFVALQCVMWIIASCIAVWSSVFVRLRPAFFIGVFLVSVSLHGLLGIGQFLLQADFASSLLGTTKHTVYAGGTSVVEYHGERWLRAYGGLMHPNIFGSLMFVGGVLSLVASLQYARHKSLQTLSVFSSFIAISGMMVSFSRSAIGVFVVMMTFFGIIIFLRSTQEVKKIYAMHAIITFMVIVIFGVIFAEAFKTRVHAETRLEQKSIDERVSQWEEAGSLFAQSPIMGVGAGNYPHALADAYPTKKVWEVQPVHNVVMLYGVELGLVGVGIALILIIGGLYKCLQKKYTFTLERAILLGLGGGVAVIGMVDHWLWSSHFGIMMCAVYGILCVMFFAQKKV